MTKALSGRPKSVASAPLARGLRRGALVAVLALAAAGTGCGQKGPLMLAPAQGAASTASR
jgi:hypothetical protein